MRRYEFHLLGEACATADVLVHSRNISQGLLEVHPIDGLKLRTIVVRVISRPLNGTNLPIRQWDSTVLNKGYIVEENYRGDTSNVLTHASFLLQCSVRNAHDSLRN